MQSTGTQKKGIPQKEPVLACKGPTKECHAMIGYVAQENRYLTALSTWREGSKQSNYGAIIIYLF